MTGTKEQIPDEGSFKALWLETRLDACPPAEMAQRGGLLADRFPWAFIAGYQAAVRHVFPEIPRGGWAAFAASEDRKDPDANPPMRLVDKAGHLTLSGTKSWVAQSRHVDHLVVTARTAEGDIVSVLVDRHQDGIFMSHRPAPSFLNGMSQGFARFEDVVVRRGDCLLDNRVNLFMRSESRFIMLACTAMLFGKARGKEEHLAKDLQGLVTDLEAIAEEHHVTSLDLASLDGRLQSLSERFAETSLPSGIDHWEEDKSLLSMYSKTIQERARRSG